MSPQVRHLLAALDQLAPFSLAESWDNTGLLVGDPGAHITSILLGLDASAELLDEAIARGANTIITHHPLIFHPLTAVITSTSAGRLLEKVLAHKLNIISCHTNLDNAAQGVSDALAQALGLTDLSPLRPGAAPGTGTGRLGVFRAPLTADAFMAKLFSVLDVETVHIAGNIPSQLSTVAVCGGSGSELAETAQACGADLYLSAEIKHSVARWAEENDFCIIDGTHYGTERPVVPFLQQILREVAATSNWSIEVLLSQTDKHPFTYTHNRFSHN